MGDDTPMPVLSHQGAPAVRLLPPAVRAGHQSADRSAARVDRDVAADADRAGVQHLRARAGARAADRAEFAGAVAAQAAPDPRAERFRASRTSSSTCSTTPSEGLQRAIAAHLRPGRSRGARRHAGAAALGSLPGRRASCRCTRCSPPAPCTTTWCETGLRCDCNLLVETGTARDPHHFACLIGYGATAVYPYLAYQTLFDMMRKGRVKLGHARAPRARPQLPARHHARACSRSCRRWASATIASYRSAQLFEIVGLADEVVELCFPGTASRIQGADFEDLEADQQVRWRRAPGIRASRSSRAACSSTCTAASTTCTTRT